MSLAESLQAAIAAEVSKQLDARAAAAGDDFTGLLKRHNLRNDQVDGVSPGTISGLRNGRVIPAAATVRAIAVALNEPEMVVANAIANSRRARQAQDSEFRVQGGRRRHAV